MTHTAAARAAPAPSDMEQRLLITERILRVFLPERVGYLIVSALSCFTLFFVIWSLIRSGKADAVNLTLMFGSTGLITYSSARVLKMFNDVMKAVVTPGTKGGDDGDA